MKFTRQKGTVVMPKTPAKRSIQGWAEEVMTTLKHLRDRGMNTPTFRPNNKHHFKVSGPAYNSDEGEYTVTVRGGWFVNRAAASGADAYERVIPYIDIDGVLTPLPPKTVAELVLQPGDAVFLNFETDDMGALKDATSPATGKAVYIIAAPSAQESVHNQPIDDGNPSGIDGDFYFPIAELEVGESPETARIKQIQQGGPITHDPVLWKGVNVGGGANVFKDRDQTGNSYRFRSIIDTEEISATQNDTSIELLLLGGGNFDIDLYTYHLSVDSSGTPISEVIIAEDSSPTETIHVRKGRIYLDDGSWDAGDHPASTGTFNFYVRPTSEGSTTKNLWVPVA